MGIAARSAEKATYMGRKIRKCWCGWLDRRRWPPLSTRSNGYAAAHADRCLPHKNRKEWVRKNTTRRRRDDRATQVRQRDPVPSVGTTARSAGDSVTGGDAMGGGRRSGGVTQTGARRVNQTGSAG